MAKEQEGPVVKVAAEQIFGLTGLSNLTESASDLTSELSSESGFPEIPVAEPVKPIEEAVTPEIVPLSADAVPPSRVRRLTPLALTGYIFMLAGLAILVVYNVELIAGARSNLTLSLLGFLFTVAGGLTVFHELTNQK